MDEQEKKDKNSMPDDDGGMPLRGGECFEGASLTDILPAEESG